MSITRERSITALRNFELRGASMERRLYQKSQLISTAYKIIIPDYKLIS